MFCTYRAMLLSNAFSAAAVGNILLLRCASPHGWGWVCLAPDKAQIYPFGIGSHLYMLFRALRLLLLASVCSFEIKRQRQISRPHAYAHILVLAHMCI